MKRTTLTTLVIVVVLFAAFLPLYYFFSYGKNDGLEQTMHEGNMTEAESAYNAPLSYGENYVESLAFGILGMSIVFAAAYTLLLVVRRKRGKGDE